jgi:hypothetical protein
MVGPSYVAAGRIGEWLSKEFVGYSWVRRKDNGMVG